MVRAGPGGPQILKGTSTTQMYEQIPMFKNGEIDTQEKAHLVLKFGIGAAKWTPPSTDIEKRFFVEVIILQLEMARK
mgnify:CR=1 FL=1